MIRLRLAIYMYKCVEGFSNLKNLRQLRILGPPHSSVNLATCYIAAVSGIFYGQFTKIFDACASSVYLSACLAQRMRLLVHIQANYDHGVYPLNLYRLVLE